MPIANLNPATPANGAAVSGGAQEIRDLKQAIQDSFTGFTTGDQVLAATPTDITNAIQDATDALAGVATLSGGVGANSDAINALEDVSYVAGIVDSAGNRVDGTAGWTVAPDSLGDYTVSGLPSGKWAIAVTRTTGGSFLSIPSITAVTATGFSVKMQRSTDGADTNTGFHFVATRWP